MSRKQIRSFNLDIDVAKDIDTEAERLGPQMKSELVNELLRDALTRRKTKSMVKAALGATEGLTVATVSLLVLSAAILVLS